MKISRDYILILIFSIALLGCNNKFSRHGLLEQNGSFPPSHNINISYALPAGFPSASYEIYVWSNIENDWDKKLTTLDSSNGEYRVNFTHVSNGYYVVNIQIKNLDDNTESWAITEDEYLGQLKIKHDQATTWRDLESLQKTATSANLHFQLESNGTLVLLNDEVGLVRENLEIEVSNYPGSVNSYKIWTTIYGSWHETPSDLGKVTSGKTIVINVEYDNGDWAFSQLGFIGDVTVVFGSQRLLISKVKDNGSGGYNAEIVINADGTIDHSKNSS